MIQVKNISKRYGKLNVLQSFSLDLTEGKVICVIGPNGSGKTTFIKCLLGMVVPDAGEIFIENELIIGSNKYRRKLGYMPQIGRYPANMTIGQVIDLMIEVRNENLQLDKELIDAFKLIDMFQKRMHTLSGGTTQKVSAALAFLFHPPILVLDEPTAGLDPIAAEVLKAKILKTKQEGKLVIVSSHILSEIDEIADEIVYMQDGKVLFHKTLNMIKEEAGELKLGKAIAKLIA